MIRIKTRKPRNRLRDFGLSLCTIGVVMPAMNITFRYVLPRLNGLPGPRGTAPDLSEFLIHLLVGALCIPIGILLIVIGNSRARTANPPVIRPCPDCGYELDGLDSPKRCPECGCELNPDLIPIPGWGKKSLAKPDDPPSCEPADQA